MEIDRAALAASDVEPSLRFFRWNKPTVTYGYLLSLDDVNKWLASLDHSPWTIDAVKRPTGGGAVLHTPSDLSLSLLWPRSSKFFADRPRMCYAQIHDLLMKALEPRPSRPLRHSHPLRHSRESGNPGFQLFSKEMSKDWIPAFAGMTAGMTAGCASEPASRFSACFQQPVCNDVMLNGKKIVGGALRVTKSAILYQGTIQLSEKFNSESFKRSLIELLPRTGEGASGAATCEARSGAGYPFARSLQDNHGK